MKKLFILFCLLTCSSLVFAQGIIGPNQACAGTTGVGYSVTTSGGGIGVGSYLWHLNGVRIRNTTYAVTIDIPASGSSHSLTVQFTPTSGPVEYYQLTINTFAPGSISINASSICYGSSVSVSFVGSGTGWEKSVNGGAWTSASPWLSNPLTEIPTQNTAYRMYLDTNGSGAGCGILYSNTVSVVVNPIPSGPGAGHAARCGAGNITLTASLGANGNELRWYQTNNSSTVLATGTSYAPYFSSTTSYWVSTYNTSTGCESGRTQVTGTVHPIPNAPSVSNNARCGEGNVNLTASPGANGDVVRWYTASSGGSHFTTGTSYNPYLSSTTSYWVGTYNSSTGCEGGRTQVTASIYPIPNAPSVSNNSRCGAGNLNLTASPGANGDVVRWYTTSSGGSPFTTGTSYNPSLSSTTSYWVSTYNSSTGCEGGRTQVTGTIYPIPNIPSVGNNARCGEGNVNLSASPGANGDVVRWYTTSSGGSHFTTGNTYQPYVSSTTSYWISTYNSSTGCEGSRAQITATVNPIPSVPAVTNNARCGTGTVNLTASPGANGDVVRWYTASSGGAPFTTGTSYLASVSSTTSYWVSTYNSTTGCEGSRVQITATVNPIPGNAVVANQQRCGTGTLTFSGTPGANASTLRWYDAASGGSLLATATSYATPSLSASTNYWVSSFNATTGCESARVQITATVNLVPQAASAQAVSRCGTGSVTLTATAGANGNSARWYAASTGGSVLFTGLSYSPTVSATTTYYVSTYNTVTTCESATRTAVQATVLVPPPTPTLVNAYNGRVGFGSITLSATGALAGTTYQWMNSAGVNIAGATQATYTTDVSNTTIFKVKLLATTSGCESAHASVTAEVLPVPVVSTSGNPYLGNGQSVVLSVQSGYAAYQWKKDGATISGATNNTYTASTAGKYSVSITTPGSVVRESDYLYVTELDNRTESSTANTCTNPAPPSVSTANRKNFVRTYDAKRPGLLANDFTYGNTDTDALSISTQYLDGLGMLVQTQTKYAAGNGEDLLIHHEYDAYGRTLREYLPYATSSAELDADGYRKNAKLEQYNFYKLGSPKVATTCVPYSEKQVEASPLNRLQKQAGPGETWMMGSGHEAESNTWALGSQDAPVHFFTVNYSNLLVKDANAYAMRELMVSEARDENKQAVREYKDKEGRVVLKRVKGDADKWLDTYYVYDVAGNLRFVLPPLLSEKSYPYATATFDSLAYQYKYDNRKRQIEKRIPGSGWTYIIYDNLDRPVLTQDAEQRSSNVNKWAFVKYDVYGRPIMTGEYIASSNYSTLRTTIAAQNSYERKNTSNDYTLNEALPVLSSEAEVYTKTFYDNYALPALFNLSTTHAYNNAIGAATYNRRVNGQSTATMVRNLQNNQWLESITYYDSRYRPLQVITRNVRGTLDHTLMQYENAISPLLIKTVHLHNAGTSSELRMEETLTYDDFGRVTAGYHSINNAAAVQVSAHAYNAINQLVERNLHLVAANDWAQSVDMRYNIKGQMVTMNDAALSTTAGERKDLFGMELYFENGYEQKQYNGNIAGTRYRNAYDGVSRSFGYVYDPLNRLRLAQHSSQHSVTQAWDQQLNVYNEEIKGYDANGNIKRLVRTSTQVIDDLTYVYQGNQLQKVTDAANVTKGFKDDAIGVDDYAYNANGSIFRDDNKAVTNITYNHLNLVKRVDKNNGEYVVYSYDALGRKLRQEVFNASNVLQKKTDYVGIFVYENDSLKFAQHSEGRIVNDVENNTWMYQYFLKDHLGNVRITFNTAPLNIVATMETANEAKEQSEFLKYEDVRKVNSTLFDHTNNGSTHYAVRLTGSTSETYGLAKSLQVVPGDRFKATVYAKYVDPNSNNWTTALNNLLTAIAAGTTSPGTVVDGGQYGSPGGATIPHVGILGNGTEPGAGPKAYLNWIVFDSTYTPILSKSGFVRMSEVAKENGSDVAHEKLESPEIIIEQHGFVYIYFSNEEAGKEVYFDDFSVSHLQTIVQADDYYAFGMTFNSYQRENAYGNKYLYNGIEKTTELDLGWYAATYRTLDPTIGRWIQIDPRVEDFYSFTPYNSNENNPIKNADPNGDCPWCAGAVLGALVEYGTQVATNLAKGNDIGDALFHNVDFGDVVLSGVEGGITAGASVGRKLVVNIATEVVKASIDVKGNGTTDVVGTEGSSKTVKTVVTEATVSVVANKAGEKGGKALVDGSSAKAVKAATSDVNATAKNLQKAINTVTNSNTTSKAKSTTVAYKDYSKAQYTLQQATLLNQTVGQVDGTLVKSAIDTATGTGGNVVSDKVTTNQN